MLSSSTFGLPGMDGLSVLKTLRGRSVNTAVLILTARDRFADKAAGFRAGADDYLTKPFQLEELLLRLQALVRPRGGTCPARNSNWPDSARYDDGGGHARRNARQALQPLNVGC